MLSTCDITHAKARLAETKVARADKYLEGAAGREAGCSSLCAELSSEQLPPPESSD